MANVISKMNNKGILITGCAFAALAVAIGAFGAHALKPILLASGRHDTFELAVRYQFYHAFALLSTGVLQVILPTRKFTATSICFSLGIIFFSGSLYVLCFTGLDMLGAITPIGGLLFLAGWVSLIVTLLKKEKPS